MQKIIIVLLCMLSFGKINASVLNGVITDEKGKPLSYASVFIKGTTNGVTANAEGRYTLQLSPGLYAIIFQYVGYERKEQLVTIGNVAITLNVSLKPQNVSIGAIKVYADAEDPAYRVIRAAIKRRRSYLQQVDAYSCKVYIKGVQMLDSIPKRVLGFKTASLGLDSSKLGIVYLSESESEYNFKQPDHIREVMISSKVSGDNKAFSYNQASDFDCSLYKNLVNISDVAERGFVSPISETAMLYYKYKLIGTFMEDGEMVNKIALIPRRPHDPVFRGYIYIVENSWRIHSTDVYLTKDANLQFIDSLKVKQTYNKVSDTIWMPFSQTLLFKFSVFGINGHGKFVGIFSNYTINPDFPKHTFKGEELKVSDDANKKDTSYWHITRPVPLTASEANDYRKKDSLSRVHNSKRYLDSLDKKRNKFELSSLLTGYYYYNRYHKTTYGITGLLSPIYYNTVQGHFPYVTLSYSKRLEDRKQLDVYSTLCYGTTDHLFSAKGGIYYLSNPKRFTSWNVSGGRSVDQINGDNPISPFVNTVYTLIEKENYMKLFDDAFIKGKYQTEITNGIMLSGAVSYGLHTPLQNTTFATWSGKADNTFTSNYPYADATHSNFTAYKSFVTEVGATFHIKQRYDTRPHQKIIIGSKYPAISVVYKKGIDALGSSVNFDQVEVHISDDIKLGLFGHAQYNVSGGSFLNNTNLGIAELKHFNGNQTIFASPDRMNSYALLPYYAYSTNQYYLQGHFEHHFEGFLVNKIPGVRRLHLHEVVGAHYLYTPSINYTEVTIGIENIFNLFRIDFVNAYSNTFKLRSGITIGFEFF